MRPPLSVLVVLALLAGCDRVGSPSVAAPPEGPRYGGTALVLTGSDPKNLLPGALADLLSQDMMRSILFTPVLEMNESMELRPALARSWEVSPDSTELTFHLRDDVYWHDGVKTTAWDLQFYYELHRTPGHGVFGRSTVPDSFTFRVEMKPQADFLVAWRSYLALPRHLLQGLTREKQADHPFGTRAPVGNGPFRAAARIDGEGWVFTANERYPEALGGRPYLDTLVVRASEIDSTLLRLQRGDAHYAIRIPVSRSAEVRRMEGVRLQSYPSQGIVSLYWNTRLPIFADAALRRSLALAIDKDRLIERVLHGHGQAAYSPIPPFLWAHDSRTGKEMQRDTAAARRGLEALGWVDRDGDGVRENAEGRPLRFSLTTGTKMAETAEMIAQDLRAVGADPRVVPVELPVLARRAGSPDRAFEALVMGVAKGLRLNEGPAFHCRERAQPAHYTGYCDPQLDSLLDALDATPRRAAARPLWIEFQERIARDQPLTPLYYVEFANALNERLEGPTPDARGDFNGVGRWWLLPRSASPETAPSP